MAKTENLELPIPHGGHVPVLNAISEAFEILDREIVSDRQTISDMEARIAALEAAQTTG